MIKTIIVEDEKNARAGLVKLLNILAPEICIVAETASVKEAIKLIQIHKPALVFLDIELEDGTSFNILNKIPKINFKIIFTTAYNHHAIKAFKYSAIDYLLKPIDPDELKTSIQRVSKVIFEEHHYYELVNVLKENVEKTNQKIVLKTSGQTFIVLVDDIIRLEGEGAYTTFILKNNRIIISKNIKYYQDLLDGNFIRCHQSHLVNAKHILSLEKGGDLLMSNRDRVTVSYRKKSKIKDYIQSLK